jgi:hypothetical protein
MTELEVLQEMSSKMDMLQISIDGMIINLTSLSLLIEKILKISYIALLLIFIFWVWSEVIRHDRNY